MRARSIIVAVAMTIFASGAHAELSNKKAKAVEAIVSTSVMQFTVFLNCSATTPKLHKLVRDLWEDLRKKTASLLAGAGAEAAHVDRFRKRTAYRSLMRTGDTFGDIIKLCNTDWELRWAEGSFTMMDDVARKALQ